MEKEKAIEYISKKLQKAFVDHPKLECDMVATEIYSYIMQSEKIKRMSTGKCEHEFEALEEDGFYPDFIKIKCAKCGLIRQKKNGKQR
jgi:hypothetical protein